MLDLQEATQSPLFVPAVLVSILGLMLASITASSCCRRRSCRDGLWGAAHTVCEHADLLASLAVFVVLPAEISKYLRQTEVDISTSSVGWMELSSVSAPCERSCRPSTCNMTECAGCGLCTSSSAPPSAPQLHTMTCSMGQPSMAIDCPALTASAPLLLVCTLHAAFALFGTLFVLTSQWANRRPLRSYGFYAFVESRRRGVWFQRFLRIFALVVAFELLAGLFLATYLVLAPGVSQQDAAARIYEVGCAMVAILADVMSQWAGGDAHVAPPRALCCEVRLAMPLSRRASAVLSAVERAYLAAELAASSTDLDAMLEGGANGNGCTALRGALAESLQPGAGGRSRHRPHGGRCGSKLTCVARQLSGRIELSPPLVAGHETGGERGELHGLHQPAGTAAVSAGAEVKLTVAQAPPTACASNCGASNCGASIDCQAISAGSRGRWPQTGDVLASAHI